MPTYEYECCDCHVRFEKRQRITDEPIAACPECGGQTRRVFHPVGIIFKGSGFYCTDNRSASGSGRGDSAPKTAEGTSESKDTKPSEKPAEKSESKSNEKALAGSASSSGQS